MQMERKHAIARRVPSEEEQEREKRNALMEKLQSLTTRDLIGLAKSRADDVVRAKAGPAPSEQGVSERPAPREQASQPSQQGGQRPSLDSAAKIGSEGASIDKQQVPSSSATEARNQRSSTLSDRRASSKQKDDATRQQHQTQTSPSYKLSKLQPIEKEVGKAEMSLSERLQRRLERIWTRLQMPMQEKLDLVLKHTSVSVSHSIEQALDLWEDGIAAIEEYQRAVRAHKGESLDKEESAPMPLEIAEGHVKRASELYARLLPPFSQVL